MSYYDDSSLFVAPNGYKTSVLFAQKPMDANGQLAFTRSNDTATRVGPDGLIEKVRTNVALYSQDFSNASWLKLNVTISTSATTNPVDGQLTAQDIIPNTTLSAHRFLQVTGVANSVNSWSIYAKANGYNFVAIVENGNTGANVSFNLSTGSVGTENSAVGQIQSLGDGWYRCTMIVTTATPPRFDVYIAPTDSLASYTGDGTSGVTLFGAQAEASDFGATAYIPTTTTAVSVGPVANLPRIDYTGGGCGKLLLEPQRTNNFRYSEYFSDSFWGKTTSTITTNSEISPDGYQNADTLTPTSASTNSGIDCFLSTSASAHTMSIYAKVTSGTKLFRFFRFNGTDGVLVSPTFTATTTWQRFTWTTTPSVAGNSWYIVNAAADTIPFHIWGAQLEEASYATSYIGPTLGSASTRGADACIKTGISSLIGQTEGTIFLDVENVVTQSFLMSFNESTTASVSILKNPSNQIQCQVWGSTLVTIFSGAVGSERLKIGFAYKSGSIAVYINGTQVGVDSTAFTFNATMDTLLFPIRATYFAVSETAKVNQALLFKTRLTNAQLAELTTL